jgi:hypothetical protein
VNRRLAQPSRHDLLEGLDCVVATAYVAIS